MVRGAKNRPSAMVSMNYTSSLEIPILMNISRSSPSTSQILVLGLNPALQKVRVFNDGINVGDVNRVSKLIKTAGGKGQICSRAITLFRKNRDRTCHLVLSHFIGGSNGAELNSILEDVGVEMVISQEVGGETRVASTLLNAKTNEVTELIDPSPSVSSEETALLLEKLKTYISTNATTLKCIAICGTSPVGAGFYAEITSLARRHLIPVVVDSFKDIVPTLEAGATGLKVNRMELCVLAGGDKEDEKEEEEPLRETSLRLFEQFLSLEFIAMTDGPGAAHLFIRNKEGEKEVLRQSVYTIPSLEGTLNPIGAGYV